MSYETIYAYVFSPNSQSQALARYFPDRRKKRKPRYATTTRDMIFPVDRSIHNCPNHIEDRAIFGDWEGDLMIFRREYGNTNVASLVERKTRYAVLSRNNDSNSNHFINRLMSVMGPLPKPHVNRLPLTARSNSLAGES